MDEVSAHLANLVADTHAPAKVRHNAQALLDRLTRAVNIGIGGPNVALVDQLLKAFPDRSSRWTIGEMSGANDMAIWCTQVFDQDELVYWDSVPDMLQDHSLLVSEPHAHVQEMGAMYFRRWCDARDISGVVHTMIQQIDHAREADADVAHALLLRHPPTRVLSPVVTIDHNPAADFLQSQAEQLAALEITDSPNSYEAVLTLCANTVRQLSEMTDKMPEQAMKDAVFDAEDAITLMTLEGGVSAAADAVSALLTLKAVLRADRETVGVRSLETITMV